jgi:hypothetical protein
MAEMTGRNLFNTFSFNHWKKENKKVVEVEENHIKRKEQVKKIKKAIKSKKLGAPKGSGTMDAASLQGIIEKMMNEPSDSETGGQVVFLKQGTNTKMRIGNYNIGYEFNITGSEFADMLWVNALTTCARRLTSRGQIRPVQLCFLLFLWGLKKSTCIHCGENLLFMKLNCFKTAIKLQKKAMSIRACWQKCGRTRTSINC